MTFSEQTDIFFNDQLREWDLANVNYRQLENVKTRPVAFDGYEVLVQFNPARITSTAAKVDARSIEKRPCFLCSENRPSSQRGLTFEPGMTLLVNPFPIFRKHLTIVADRHIDQRISGNFGTMLSLARELPDYQVFYNGPQCGASAPDHFHFQAGNKGFLPIERDFSDGKKCRLHASARGIELWTWQNYGRELFTLTGSNPENIISAFDRFYSEFYRIQSDKPEPMLNILTSYANERWIVHFFPRKVHRPAQFFIEGHGKILLSPASVDLGGVVITPREEDYEKITAGDLADIFRQVSVENSELIPMVKDIL